MTDQYAVMGNPVAHSKSPKIHSLFGQQTGQDISYIPILVEPGEFPQAVKQFADQGGKGLNITVPFKVEAFELANRLTERASLAGAVNTLSLNSDGSIDGDNTDGAGLIRDLTVNTAVSLKNSNILVLGAGGAVRGILLPLAQQNPSSITIVNRTPEKAETLAEDFADHCKISVLTYDQLTGHSYDLVINGTSASLAMKLPPLPDGLLTPQAVCYDLAYADKPTAFVEWGIEQQAAISIDGLGMLVEQAAESFTIWRGIRPETASVIKAIRENR